VCLYFPFDVFLIKASLVLQLPKNDYIGVAGARNVPETEGGLFWERGSSICILQQRAVKFKDLYFLVFTFRTVR
jgi:hypothetical protein